MTERELMEKVSPGFVRWLMRYAPGYELLEDADRVGFMLIEYNGSPVFDLLVALCFPCCCAGLRSAGIPPVNRIYHIERGDMYVGVCTADSDDPYARYMCYDYRADTLTEKECALLHCLMDVYSEVCAGAPVAG